jgi:hypothetical protein
VGGEGSNQAGRTGANNEHREFRFERAGGVGDLAHSCFIGEILGDKEESSFLKKRSKRLLFSLRLEV